MSSLPELCEVCRKLKVPSLGRFKKSGQHGKRRFICYDCTERRGTSHRDGRLQHRQSPLEEQVNRALVEAGFKVIQEYRLDGKFFDFAVPSIRLIIEVDSKRYHRFGWQKRNDKIKDQVAKDHHWELVRISGDDVAWKAVLAANSRKSLFTNA